MPLQVNVALSQCCTPLFSFHSPDLNNDKDSENSDDEEVPGSSSQQRSRYTDGEDIDNGNDDTSPATSKRAKNSHEVLSSSRSTYYSHATKLALIIILH